MEKMRKIMDKFRSYNIARAFGGGGYCTRINKTICTENPLCASKKVKYDCPLSDYCKYYKDNVKK